MMGVLSRRKGHTFEREVAARFRAVGIPAKRTLTETREGNQGDLELAAPLSVQCKCGAEPNVWRALREARAVAKPGHYALAVVKRSERLSPYRNMQEVAVLDLEDFLELCRALKACGAW